MTCNPCSASKTQQPTPPSPSQTPTPSAQQISDDSMLNVLQFNANGIGNKLTELGVVLERNKVKVAVIHESKLSSKSKNPCIRNYTTVCKDRPHVPEDILAMMEERDDLRKQDPACCCCRPHPSTEEWWRGPTIVSTHTGRWYTPSGIRNPGPLVDWWPPSIQPAGNPPRREASTNP